MSMQIFIRKTEERGGGVFLIPRRRRKNKIKFLLKKGDGREWTGAVWLSIWTKAVLLGMRVNFALHIY
jgi:hypothetical protein